jgi:solute carrier family 9B (sodium/hydrogen exchanger), member 1/2
MESTVSQGITVHHGVSAGFALDYARASRSFVAFVYRLEIWVAFNIAELILLGLLFDWVFRKMRMPGLIGLLLLGVVAGPYLAPDFVAVSADLRLIALIIILLRAGLELSSKVLKRVGVQALLMAFVPGVLEGGVIALLGPHLFPLTGLESAMLGFIIAAVSPAVVVPMMIQFVERRMGAKKGVPTLIMAAASLDDVFAIVMFSVFLAVYTGSSEGLLLQLAGVPFSIVLGIGGGVLLGLFLLWFFERFNPRATKRTLILIGCSVLFVRVEQLLAEWGIPFAALLAVMAAGFMLLKNRELMAHEISSKLGKLWVFASIMLFTLVGAQVDIGLAFESGSAGLLLIFAGLVARSVGVQLCLLRSPLNRGERLFAMVSYWPKATVQAAIGSVPLMQMRALGKSEAPGQLILAISVLAIVITAPLGAIVIKWVGERVLTPEESDGSALEAASESV